jgi:hypothetical protein
MQGGQPYSAYGITAYADAANAPACAVCTTAYGTMAYADAACAAAAYVHTSTVVR